MVVYVPAHPSGGLTSLRWPPLLARMVAAAFGALANVTSQRLESLQVLREDASGAASSALVDEALQSTREFQEALRAQRGRVRVAPLSEVAAVLVSGVE